MTDALNSLLSPIHASAAMRAIMNDRARLQRMLDFEAALARAEAAVGIISASAAVEIAEACRAERYDLAALAEASGVSGPAGAMVEALTLEVARNSKTAAGFVHWGASTQDVIDTTLALELRAAIDALLVDLNAATKSFTALAGRHRRAFLPARVQMQHTLPVPFGLKLAGYAAALARSRERLTRLRREALVLQFGGSAGTLASYAENGLAVTDRLGALLDLPVPEAPWHAHRDRLAEVGADLAILAGTCGKIASDVALMMQIEVGEAADRAAAAAPPPPNPYGVAAALSAASIAPSLASALIAAQAQEHERGLVGAQTEWTTFPMLALVTSGAVEAIAQIAERLEIDVDRMRSNLELSGGWIMSEAVTFALAEKIGREEARTLVQELKKRTELEDRPFKELVIADSRIKAELTSTAAEKLFIPLTYQGSAQFFLDRLVFAAQPRAARRVEFRAPEPRPAGALQPAAAPATPPAQATVAAAAPAPESQPAPQPASQPVAPAMAVEPQAPAPTEPRSRLAQVEAELRSSEEAAPSVAVDPAPSDQNEPPEFEQAQPAAAEHDPSRQEPPASEEADDNAPGAFMDILSRAEAEANALDDDPGKRNRS